MTSRVTGGIIYLWTTEDVYTIGGEHVNILGMMRLVKYKTLVLFCIFHACPEAQNAKIGDIAQVLFICI